MLIFTVLSRALKWSSLQQRANKFAPKLPYGIDSRGRIHNILSSSQLTNGPNKLERYKAPIWKSLQGTNTPAYGAKLYVINAAFCHN